MLESSAPSINGSAKDTIADKPAFPTIACLHSLIDAIPDTVIVTDRDGRIVFVNAAVEKFFGYSQDQLIGQNVDILVPNKVRGRHMADRTSYMANPSQRSMGARHGLRAVRADGTEFPVAVSLGFADTESGRMVIATIQDQTELHQRDRSIKQLNERLKRDAQLATIVATSGDAIISLSDDGTILSWNPGAEWLFGYTADEVIGRSERMLFAEDADEEFEEKHGNLLLGDHVVQDTVRRRKDGVLIDVAINAAPMRQPDGRIIGFSTTIRDISERKRDEKHMRVVMRELSHRTKNQLAVIMAMVRLTESSTTNAAVLQSELIERLQSLSASHDLLVAEDWTGAPLEGIARAVLQPFVGSSSDVLECGGPSVTVNAVAVQNLGLALHELATNAAKYGALSTRDGRVRLTWSFEPDDKGQRRLILDWSERNGPPVQQPTIKGFGHVVIERFAPQALNADVVYEFPREGVHWTIAIPTDFVVRSCAVPLAKGRA